MTFIPTPCVSCAGGPSGTTPLDCLTDSVTVCPGDDPIVVTIDGQPIDVNIVSGNPPGGFTPVAGSRFAETGSDDLSLLGVTDLTLLSPIPGAGQVVVVTDLSYFISIAVGLALTTLEVVVRQVSDATVLWQASVGFAAGLGIGSSSDFSETDLYIFGGLGEQLEYVIDIQAGLGVTAAVSSNFGGYLATP